MPSISALTFQECCNCLGICREGRRQLPSTCAVIGKELTSNHLPWLLSDKGCKRSCERWDILSRNQRCNIAIPFTISIHNLLCPERVKGMKTPIPNEFTSEHSTSSASLLVCKTFCSVHSIHHSSPPNHQSSPLAAAHSRSSYAAQSSSHLTLSESS